MQVLRHIFLIIFLISGHFMLFTPNSPKPRKRDIESKAFGDESDVSNISPTTVLFSKKYAIGDVFTNPNCLA